jgi:DNA/RNA-binding domain of Phe-tRNA-synthetase-like protein
MPVYSIDTQVFELFPEFTRGVIIATGLDNRDQDDSILKEGLVSAKASGEEAPQIAAWNDAYTKLGVDPKKFTPSIRFLNEQIRRGKPPRSINKIVDIMNITSIRWTIPCGGDDLRSIAPGDLRLSMATGNEVFAPLFKPTAIEHPNPGEVIYYTPQSNRVMCRRWTWRNADFSKITTETTSVAINIDFMIPPFKQHEVRTIGLQVASLLEQHCGAKTSLYELSAGTPTFQFDLV